MSDSAIRAVVADEIGRISQALQRPLPQNWIAQIDRFAPWWLDYLEYQLPLQKPELAIITLGRNAHFVDTIIAQMGAFGVHEAAIAHFQQLANWLPNVVWGVKLTLTPQPEVQVYAKHPLPLEQLALWLRLRNVSNAVIEQIVSIGRLLEKSHLHFFGADFSSGSDVAYQIYFTQWMRDDNDRFGRIAQVAQQISLNASIEPIHQQLAKPNETLWISFTVAHGQLLPTLKIDYPDVSLASAPTICDQLAIDPTHYQPVLFACDLLRTTSADFMGVRWSADRSPAAAIYLTRR